MSAIEVTSLSEAAIAQDFSFTFWNTGRQVTEV
jgi:hypothetical protein